MNLPLIILGVVGTLVIFAIAVWLSPKIIRAIFPEEQHEQMLSSMRVMVIIALVILVLAIGSSLPLIMQGG